MFQGFKNYLNQNFLIYRVPKPHLLMFLNTSSSMIQFLQKYFVNSKIIQFQLH